MGGKIALADFVCPTERARQEFAPDFTVWMNTIAEGRFEDTNKMFEEPPSCDYHVKEWFDDTHAPIIRCCKKIHGEKRCLIDLNQPHRCLVDGNLGIRDIQNFLKGLWLKQGRFVL